MYPKRWNEHEALEWARGAGMSPRRWNEPEVLE